MRAVRVLVNGSVQGVGFRAFVLQHGRDLGLGGWVRNLSNGGVETEAAGPEPLLQQFVEAVREGPGGRGWVREVSVSWFDTAEVPPEFHITR